jgi:exopolysaccharide biosynthesis polyprenyl glycosylphosphotransferase
MSDPGVSIEVAERARPLRPAPVREPLSQRWLWRDPLLRRMLAAADLMTGVLFSLSLALSEPGSFAWSLLFLPLWVLLAKLHGLYDRDHRSLRHLTVDELPSILAWALSGTALVTLLLLATPPGTLSLPAALWGWMTVTLGAFVLRSSARVLWRKVTPPERTLIVGTGPLAAATRRKLELFPDVHLDVVANRPSAEVGSPAQWLVGIDRVILASGSIDERAIADIVAICRQNRIKFSMVPPARGMFGTAVQLSHVADLPVVEYTTWDVSRSTLLLKRILDIVVSVVTIALLLPLGAIIAICIKVSSRGPVIFAQRRSGLNGKPFRMYKFRTMVSDAEARLSEVISLDDLRDPMFKLPHDPRVTRVGRLLRRTSLDELPQLINVLKGDMSLVGPRPEQVELVDRYRPEHRFRLDVKPGITGPMQVYGRGALSFDERLALEREYIENLSLGRDLHLLALTLAAVAGGRGAF